MRTVLQRDEIPHLWAHQSQEHARTPNGSLSFQGSRLISYRTTIAQHVTNERGERAVVLSTHKYSVTTSGHQWAARNATLHLTQLYVDSIESSHAYQRDHFAATIRRAIEDIASAKNRVSRAKRRGVAENLVRQANAYCEFFDLESFPALPGDDSDIIAELTAQRKREEQAQRKRKRERDRLARENLAQWLAGENVSTYGLNTAFMRLTADGETIETTMGATVPTEHVRRVAPLVLRLIASGGTYRRNGHTIHLGHYALDSIDEDGTVKAGCHTFERTEIIRIAELLGVQAETTV